MQNYHDLKVWAKAHVFTLQVYNTARQFPQEELYGLTSQLKRAAASVPANISEGCGKISQRELANFLNISLGSANESEYFLLLAKDLGYMNLETFNALTENINEIKAMLISLIKSVRSKL
ncbi:four helix bundle protein [Taibaiella soli]|uniref:Four helix bundle protein n=1 Tax=Taibaiella soli TaxID=1649169 RepID=A0A2W2AFM2_9BACT|nr:four helix bundle protein [Taibaiella soli]PZF74101.1 four helix bundle protein [Taibaiella soli]